MVVELMESDPVVVAMRRDGDPLTEAAYLAKARFSRGKNGRSSRRCRLCAPRTNCRPTSGRPET
jgi:hypothetical protein